ncbi:hypothetical protein ACE1CI_22250 [Aerosakkonemataceae cyanobacterium BLCC-F50]|uniref:Uncharacterized protein n=1 Tax=Floridaenema flaviceps BLCC-F50 TaxID=3153642 RepID=A0ABV4XX47_9CYAN
MDGEYPYDRPEVLNFLSKSPISVTDESGNLVANPALLPLMKWGEVIIDDDQAGGDRDLGVYSYIVNDNRGQFDIHLCHFSVPSNGRLTKAFLCYNRTTKRGFTKCITWTCKSGSCRSGKSSTI